MRFKKSFAITYHNYDKFSLFTEDALKFKTFKQLVNSVKYHIDEKKYFVVWLCLNDNIHRELYIYEPTTDECFRFNYDKTMKLENSYINRIRRVMLKHSR